MKNKKNEYEQLSPSLFKEVENIMLTIGKEAGCIVYDFRVIFRVYLCNDQRVMKENKPLAAIFAYGDAYKAISAKKEDGGMVVCGYGIDLVMEELINLVAYYEEQIKDKAA